jgi:hypothetical protein
MNRSSWEKDNILRHIDRDAAAVGDELKGYPEFVRRLFEERDLTRLHVLTSHADLRVYLDARAVSDHVGTYMSVIPEGPHLLRIVATHHPGGSRPQPTTSRAWVCEPDRALQYVDEALELLRLFSSQPDQVPTICFQ